MNGYRLEFGFPQGQDKVQWGMIEVIRGSAITRDTGLCDDIETAVSQAETAMLIHLRSSR